MRYRTFVSLWIGVAAMMLVAVCGNAQNAKASKLAQLRSHTQVASPDATHTCTYSYTVGSGNTYMNYCITVNGNFANFESPSGVEMLAQPAGDAFEGYGICDVADQFAYYDYAYTDSGNWDAPTLVTQTASEVKIERTTSDGLWTLTQTITKEAGPPPYAKITMALKNGLGITKSVYLERYANMENDNAGASLIFQENYDATLDSAWGYNSYSDSTSDGGGVYGLMLQNIGSPSPTSVPYAILGYTISTTTGPDPCSFSNAGTITYANGSGLMFYVFELNKEQTVTVNARYQSF